MVLASADGTNPGLITVMACRESFSHASNQDDLAAVALMLLEAGTCNSIQDVDGERAVYRGMLSVSRPREESAAAVSLLIMLGT